MDSDAQHIINYYSFEHYILQNPQSYINEKGNRKIIIALLIYTDLEYETKLKFLLNCLYSVSILLDIVSILLDIDKEVLPTIKLLHGVRVSLKQLWNSADQNIAYKLHLPDCVIHVRVCLLTNVFFQVKNILMNFF